MDDLPPMLRHAFADLSVGMQAEFTRRISSEDLEMFRRFSGDDNPLHCDAGYARERGFPDRVVYGMLTASYFSTLVGMYLPGENALFHGLQVDFVKPVFPGDTLSVHGKVVAVDERFQRIEIRGTIRNQEGSKVCRAKIFAGVTDGA